MVLHFLQSNHDNVHIPHEQYAQPVWAGAGQSDYSAYPSKAQHHGVLLWLLLLLLLLFNSMKIFVSG
jgi:hypothetical protein